MPHLTAITWNYADLLRSASNGTFTSCYVYNAGGGRTRKVVVKGNIREERVYLGNYELYRKYVNNTLDTERQTLHVADDQHRFALIDRLTVNNGATLTTPTIAVRYQYDNHLGSASLELDQNAAIISYEEYHPFGTTSYRSGRTETEVALKRYKYVGKERDEETGLYYYGARYYAAWIARFVSVDPLQLKYPHYTPYQYAGNKPVSYIDLDGLEEAKLPTIPYHTKQNGSVTDNSTAGKLVDNTFAALGNMFIGMVNYTLDLSSTVAYNAGYIYEKGAGQWASDVKEAWSADLESVKEKTVSFVQQPAEDQWRDVDDYVSSPAGFELIVNAAALYVTAKAPTLFGSSSLSLKPSLKIKSVKNVAVAEENAASAAVAEETSLAAKCNNLVKIDAIEDDIIIFSARIGKETVEGIANFTIKDSRLYLDKLHLQGSAPGLVGRESLWDMAKDLGRQYNVKEVIIQGGKRTTGKYKGQVPTPNKIKVD